MPPIPITELTALFGNISVAVENKLALRLWWAATATAMSVIAISRL